MLGELSIQEDYPCRKGGACSLTVSLHLSSLNEIMPVFEAFSIEEIMEDAVGRCNLKFLRTHQIFMLDEALTAIGGYGEVRLVINDGSLRFLVINKSFDTCRWRKGDFFRNSP
jgi:hypothetical protein